MPQPRGHRPPNAGKGRPRGAANRVTKDLREMILGALDDAGGQDYLAEQAHKNPAAFLALVARLLPREPPGPPPPTEITLDFGNQFRPRQQAIEQAEDTVLDVTPKLLPQH